MIAELNPYTADYVAFKRRQPSSGGWSCLKCAWIIGVPNRRLDIGK